MTTSHETSPHVLLATAIIYVYDYNVAQRECRALLDSCSQPHIITTALCERLGLERRKGHVTLSGIEHGTQRVAQTIITIKSRFTEFTRTITCLIIDEIDNETPTPGV